MERSKLIEARKRRFPGWSVKRVADHISLGETTLIRLEKGHSAPRAETIMLLAQAYGVDVGDLGFEDDLLARCQIASASSAPSEVTAMPEHISKLLKEDLAVRLMRIITREKEVGMIQQQIDRAVEQYEAAVHDDLDQVIPRRNALRSIVLLPLEACALVKLSRPTRHIDELLMQCAAGIAACRHFSAGKELTLSSDALTMYIGALKVVVLQSEQARETAAGLLAQSLMLKGELSRHVENIDQSIAYLHEAIHYAEISQDVLMQSLAWRTQAATYYHAERWNNCFKTTDKALKLMKSAPKGLFSYDAQSFVTAGAATYLAIEGKAQQARETITASRAAFEKQANDGPKWSAHSYCNLLHNEALSALYLRDFAPAAQTMQTLLVTPGSTRVQAAQYHLETVRVEVARDDRPRDMDLCIEQWTAGVTEAKELQSTQRLVEARQMLNLMRIAWPQEQRIKDLQTLLTTL